MDNIIVTSILIIGAITTAAVVVFSITSNTSSDSQITAKIQSSQSQEIRTKIRIVSATVNPQGTSMRVWARNIGSTDIEPIDGIDVILERMDNTWGSVIPFSVNSGMSWSLESAPDSGLSNSIWETDETVQFIIAFPDAPSLPLAQRSGIYQVTLVTPNGVVEKKVFEHNPIPFSTPTPDPGAIWGSTISTPPAFFYASDVPSEVKTLLEEAIVAATVEWGNYGPLYYWVAGTNVSAAQDLADQYCSIVETLSDMTRDDCLRDEYLARFLPEAAAKVLSAIQTGTPFSDAARTGNRA